MRIVATILQVAFLFWSGSLVFFYFFMLNEKITRPGLKNMNDREVIVFGLLALPFIAIDVLIIGRLIRQRKK